MACQISAPLMLAPFNNQKGNAEHTQKMLNPLFMCLHFVHLTYTKVSLLSPVASRSGGCVIWSVTSE